MLRGIPRSLANASRYNRCLQLQCRNCSAASSDNDAAAATTDKENMSVLSLRFAKLDLGTVRGARGQLPPRLAGVRSMCSLVAKKTKRPFDYVMPHLPDGKALPSNLKLDTPSPESPDEDEGEYGYEEEEEADEVEGQADDAAELKATAEEAEDDAEAAALEKSLPPSPEAPKKTREDDPVSAVYDGPFIHGFKGTEVPVISWREGTSVGTKALDPDVFGVPIRRDVVHDVIRWQLAKRRPGNYKTKRRDEIRGSGRKLRPQKGQGRARVGSGRVSQFRGGAKAHGPRIRDWSFKLNKKFVKLGLRCALSARLMEGKLKVVDDLNSRTFSTSGMLKTLEARGLDHQVLFIDENFPCKEFVRSTTNIVGVKILPARGANVYDIIKRRDVVITTGAVAHLEEALKPI